MPDRLTTPGSWTLVHATAEPWRSQALSLLLTGLPVGGESSVASFLQYVREQKLSLDMLYMSRSQGVGTAACLVVPCAGRTGMLFFSPVQASGDAGHLSSLLRAACEQLPREQLTMVQAVIEPDRPVELKALQEAGLKHLADLTYMYRRTEAVVSELKLPAGLVAEPWSPRARPLFEQAILQSYEHTLDCPDLRGHRQIEDIVAGHIGAGIFCPELWLALRAGDEPAGVMLINMTATPGSSELVYLGLSPAWRGRGLGRVLVTHGLGLVRQKRGATSMVLAVDDRNKPAVSLYRSLEFIPTAHKVALFMPLASARV